jgi:hypothetical protein
LLNFVSVASLALCTASVILWVRSYRKLGPQSEADRIDFTRREPLYWIISNPGCAVLCGQQGRRWEKPLRGFDLAGVRFGGLWGPGSVLWNLAVPYWMLTAAAGVLPLIRLNVYRRRRLRVRRLRAGLCPACGYDLRATPGRCPECGATPGAASPTVAIDAEVIDNAH